MMDDVTADRNPVEKLAEDFLERKRRGESPQIHEYVARHPQLADDIRELFPALVLMEDFKPETGDLSDKDGEPPVDGKEPLPEKIGDYRILREIGRGGMGLVYEAEQLSLGRRVALKILPQSLATDAKSLARFRIEARNAAKLHHTNIVPVFEVGIDDRTSYYAMQYIHGQGLDQVLTELVELRSADDAFGDEPRQSVSPMTLSLCRGQFPEKVCDVPAHLVENSKTPDCSPSKPRPKTDTSNDTLGTGDLETSNVKLPGSSDLSVVQSGRSHYFGSVAHIGWQVADALAYAHSRGVVHRDIKPSNLLLDAGGVVWITDFGLAKAEEDDLTQTGDVFGTYRYMAPERFRGGGDARGDVYALGATLYELLTLKPAFESKDRLRIVDQIANLDPPRPRSVDPSIPRDLETIVTKALEKSPKDRYQSADAMSEDLRRFVQDEPISARRVSPVERFVRWSRHNKPLAASLSTIAILLAATTVAAILFAGEYKEIASQETHQRHETEKALGRAQESERQLRHGIYIAGGGALPTYGVWPNNWYQYERLLELLPAEKEKPFEAFWHRGVHQEPDRRFRTPLATVFDFDVSSSGELAATSGGFDDKRVMLWDMASGQVRRVIYGPDSGVFAISFHPTKDLLAVAYWNGTVSIYETRKGHCVRTLRQVGPQRACAVCWDPAGKRLAIAGKQLFPDVGKIVLCTLDSGETKPLEVASMIIDAEWHPDGQRIVCGHIDGGLSIIDTAEYRVERHWGAHDGAACDVAWDPDGGRIASAGKDSFVFVWDEHGSQICKLSGHGQNATAVAWSPDGEWLISSGSESLRLWHPESGAQCLRARAQSAGWNAMQWNVMTGEIALGTTQDGTVDIWDSERLLAMRAMHEQGPLSDACVSGNGSRFAYVQETGPIHVWDLLEATPWQGIARPEAGVAALAFDSTGARLAVVCDDNSIRLFDLEAEKFVKTIKPPEGEMQSFTQAAWRPGHDLLLLACRDGKMHTLNLEKGQWLKTWDPRVGSIRRLACGPHGTLLAVGGVRGIQIVDMAERSPCGRLGTPRNWLNALAWGPDGHTLAYGGGTISPNSAALTQENPPSSGQRFAEGGIRLWQLGDSPQNWRTLATTSSAIEVLAWHPDGQRLLSKTANCQAQVWDVTDFGDIPVKQDLLTAGDIDASGGRGFWAGHGMLFVLVDRAGAVRVGDARPGYRAARSSRMLPQLENRIRTGRTKPGDRQLRAEILLAQDEPEKAAEKFDALPKKYRTPWQTSAWWTIGSFLGSSDAKFAPEKALQDGFPSPSDLAASQVSGRKRRWQLRPTDAPIDLNRFYSPTARRCCYALTRCYAAKERQTWLVVAKAADGDRIWWNDPASPIDPQTNTDVVPVVLQPGWNTLMVKTHKVGEKHILDIKLSDNAVELGRVCNSAGLWEKAIGHWNRALKADPDDVRSRAQRAQAMRRAGMRKEALAECRVVLEQASDYPDVVPHMVWIMSNLGFVEEALERLDEQSNLSGEFHGLRAKLCCSLGRWSEAKDAYREEGSMNRSDGGLHMSQAAIIAYSGLRDMEEYQSICEDFLNEHMKRGMKTITADTARRIIQAWLLVPRSEEEWQRLAPLMDLARNGKPYYRWTWLTYGQWLLRQGDFDAAATELERCRNSRGVVRQDFAPQLASALLAHVYYKTGDRELAAERLNASRGRLSERFRNGPGLTHDALRGVRLYEESAALLEVDPKTAGLELQAHVLLANGEVDNAADLAAQIDDQDDNRSFLLFRGYLMGRARRWSDAARDLKHALELDYDSGPALRRAYALVLADDLEGFREHARWSLQEHKKNPSANGWILHQRAEAIVVAPLPQEDPLFDRGFEIIRESLNKAPNAPWTWVVLAIGEYRARHYEKAIRVARTAYGQAAQLPPNGQIHAKCMTLGVEAAALARSREEDKATAVVQRLERMLNNELPKMNEPNVLWHGRAIAELLCEEARTLLDGRSKEASKSN